jgi:hypothetical protein
VNSNAACWSSLPGAAQWLPSSPPAAPHMLQCNSSSSRPRRPCRRQEQPARCIPVAAGPAASCAAHAAVGQQQLLTPLPLPAAEAARQVQPSACRADLVVEWPQARSATAGPTGSLQMVSIQLEPRLCRRPISRVLLHLIISSASLHCTRLLRPARRHNTGTMQTIPGCSRIEALPVALLLLDAVHPVQPVPHKEQEGMLVHVEHSAAHLAQHCVLLLGQL